jgi:hypothetical protein
VSYIVEINSAPPPASYQEALAVSEEIARQDEAAIAQGLTPPFGTPLEIMVELHRRLTARFPCISEDPDGPWSDGPLLNNFRPHSATLGISFARVAEVLPFLVATAVDLRCWVFDAQDDAVHLPGGAILRAPPEAAAHRGPPAEAVDPAPLPEARAVPRRPWWRFR